MFRPFTKLHSSGKELPSSHLRQVAELLLRKIHVGHPLETRKRANNLVTSAFIILEYVVGARVKSKADVRKAWSTPSLRSFCVLIQIWLSCESVGESPQSKT
jgi:hypothetical protein